MKKLPHEIYQKALDEILQNNLPKTRDKYEVTFSAGSLKGDNYLGIIHRIQVKDIESETIVLSIIAKLPPENASSRDLLDTTTCFKRESTFYDNLYPVYIKFQKNKGIDVEKDGFHQVPFCYKTLTEVPHEGLFFEDLKVLGFQMFDRKKEVTKEHVFLIMETLAKFHAVYLCIKHQNPELLQPYLNIKDHFIKQCEREDSSVNAWIEGMKEQALEMIEKKEQNEVTKKVKHFYKEELYSVLKRCIYNDSSKPYSVLCHGDCWNNNIMFRNDQDDTPDDLRFLDFQLMRFASPVTDLMYYIFGCTTKALRDKYYQAFLDVYYETLSSFIVRLGSDTQKIFPRHIFEDHLKEFGKFGLVMATIVVPIFTCNIDDIPSIDEISDKIEESKSSVDGIDVSVAKYTSPKTYDVYAERMMGVFEDMIKYGYI